jgi:hypothetical protein
MAVNLSPVGGVAGQFFDNNGNPLSGGKIFTYAAGTTTNQVTYTNASGGIAHANPIILDSAGRVPSGEIWLTDGLQYKFVITDSNNVLIGTYDNIIGINSNFVNFTNEQEIQTATAGQTVFTLTTMSYQPATNSLSVFVDGVNQYGPGALYAYVETDSTTVTFTTGLHVGAEVKFTTSNLNSSAGGDAFQVSYTPPFTSSVTTNVGDKLAQTVSAKDFGAVGDGVADDTTALQNALNSNQLIFLPKGNYRITSSLVFDPAVNRNTGFVGETSISWYPTTTQPGGPPWGAINEVVITYDGPVSTTTAIILASAEPVGVQVAQTFSNSIFGFYLRNVLLDGQNKAGFGLYAIRLQEPLVQNVIATNTTQHAFYIDQAYSGQYVQISAFKNLGCGISVGRGELDYGWTAGKFINAVYFSDIYAAACGADKTFDEVTNPLWGYGIGLWFHRGNVVTSYTSENNDGVGIVLAPTSFPNVILSGYSELSNSLIISGTNAITDGRATRKWGCWFVGDVSAGSLNSRLTNVFMAAEGIRLTGTQPSSTRPEGGFSLENIAGANYLEADWGNYRLVNCSKELFDNITGVAPAGSQLFAGGIRFDTAATGNLNYYEFKTFTPTLRGTTIAGTGWAYTINEGSYVRVGNMVTVTGRITLSAKSGDATGPIVIAGLPFNTKTTNPYNGAVTLSRIEGLVTAIVSASGNYILNSDQISLRIRTAASTSSATVALSDIGNTFSVDFTGTYFVD